MKIRRFPALGLLALTPLAFAADVDKLRPVVASILEQHGIVGNAGLERQAPAASASRGSGVGPLSVSSSPGLDFPLPSHAYDVAQASVAGVILGFSGGALAERAAANLPPPPEVLEALAAASPVPLRYIRPMSLARYVFRFQAPLDKAEYDALAERLQELTLIATVDADVVVSRKQRPNDPYFLHQWSLLETGEYSEKTGSSVVGVNAVGAWDLVYEYNSVTVAVVDTGLTYPLPVPAARVLPGFDFITDPERARDGDGWDSVPDDEGDYRGANECELDTDQASSSWHGAAMASIIAASGNDGAGIAGIDWRANVLPVRVLGKCGGEVSDVVDGMLWAAGYPVPGAPVNEHPARIINMSLGRSGEGSCSSLYQTAFTTLRNHYDVIVVASAGNDSADAALHQPSSCEGPVSVAAVDHRGERASYSNWNDEGYIDIAAPGGDRQRYGTDGYLVGVGDTGEKEPTGESFINWTGGTSAAAAHVSGALSLAIRVDPLQHTDLLLAVMLETAQPFGVGSECEREYPRCGVGILDIEALIQGAMVFKDYAVVRDFYHAGLKHYFRSGNWDEVSLVVKGQFGAWQELDDYFLAWRTASESGLYPVCRFYGTPGVGPNSHFYTVDPEECEFVKQNDPGWTYEGTAFYAKRLNQVGGCPRNTRELYRYYNQLAHVNDSNHRYTTSLVDRQEMEDAGWVMEGVAMCVPS